MVTERILGSNNASCLPSHDNIPYVHGLNQQNKLKIRKWMYTEVCTGKGCIDTHLSFVNMKLKSYCIDEHNICDRI